MKKEINIGNVVDDGTGDTLRDASKKIVENFTEIYDGLGDGLEVHPAGAWAKSSKDVLTPKFGQTFAINASNRLVKVTLPKGTSVNYAMVIKLRDVWNSWSIYGVQLVPAKGDTIKGSSKPVLIKQAGADLELIYSAPGRWEYIENKRINTIATSDLNSVAKREFIVETDGQVDFLNVFDGDQYNINNTTVHWRGNLLSYGNEFSPEYSDFGSPGKKPGEIVKLDGHSIRLKNPTKKGDSVIITSFLDGIATWRASYSISNVRVIDPRESPERPINGSSSILDIQNPNKIKLSSFDANNLNPNSIRVSLNGVLLAQIGTLGVPAVDYPEAGPILETGYDLNNQYSGYCVGAISGDKIECVELGGQWYEGIGDYRFEYDSGGLPEEIIFNTTLKHNDVISIEWYNNNIGTFLELEDIIIKTDNRYISKGSGVTLTDQIEYTEYKNNPTQSDVRPAPDTLLDSISSIEQVFGLLYPIGTIYENGHNSANPRNYMGFGTWVRYSEGLASVGWDSNKNNALFNINQQDLDQNGNPKSTAGGIVGNQNTLLNNLNIPPFKIEGSVLVSDPEGTVSIGGCLEDPEGGGPGYRTYSEKILTVGNQSEGFTPTPVSVVQPSITTYKWIRVA